MKKTSNVIVQVLMWLMCIIFIIPLYWLFVSSVKSDREITLFPPTFWPKEFIWSNFSDIWEKLNFAQTFMNSIFVTVIATVFIVLFSTMAGYAFSKKKVVGKNFLLTMLVGTMTVPPIALLLPLYFIITKIGLYDSLWGLILPFAVTVFAIFFMKQYIDDVPDELLESARMDGCKELYLFFRIVVPLVKPAIATIAIITFVDNWNAFTMPLVLIQDPNKYTLPLKLAMISADTVATPWSKILAANVLTIIPVVVLFLGLQRFFIKGIMDGAVKG